MAGNLVVMAGVSMFVAYTIRETVGGKRSSAGVHRPDGRLLPSELGTIVTIGILAIGAFTATNIKPYLMESLGKEGAMILALVLVYIVVKRENYDR